MTYDSSVDQFKKNMKIMQKISGHVMEAHYSIQGKDQNVYQMVGSSNSRLDSNGKALYSRTFLRNDTERFIQQTLKTVQIRTDFNKALGESKDHFTRQLFHQTKTPLQILMALHNNANFTNQDDTKAFSSAIASLADLSLDMSILCGNINNGECLQPEVTFIQHVKELVSEIFNTGEFCNFSLDQFQYDFDPVCNSMKNVNRLLPRALHHLILNAVEHGTTGSDIQVTANIITKQNKIQISVINQCDDDININLIRNSLNNETFDSALPIFPFSGKGCKAAHGDTASP